MTADPKPHRVQLRRLKGWRMPENTVKVARPGPFGNPFTVADIIREFDPGTGEAQRMAVDWFRRWITNPTSDDCMHESGFGGRLEEHTKIREGLPALRGRNLACWCALDQPCHADVLLEIANAE